MNIKGMHFHQDDISAADTPFLNLPAQNANAVDLQMQLQLEMVYEATEDGRFSCRPIGYNLLLISIRQLVHHASDSQVPIPST
jgi:hypothetical protein